MKQKTRFKQLSISILAGCLGASAYAQNADATNENAEQTGKPYNVVMPLTVVEAVSQVSSYDSDGRFYTRSSSFALGGSDATLKETPFSISVVDSDFLNDSALKEPDDTSLYVAGVQAGNDNTPFAQSFQIRGFGADRNGTLINGTQQADGFAVTPSALLSSIEIYRGPSSALNGQTTPGGAVNLVTKKPLSDSFTRISGDLDSEGKREAALDFNSGGFDIAGVEGFFRFNVSREDSNSFRDSLEREVDLFAPVLSLNFGDATTLTLEANFIDTEVTGDRGLPLLGGDTDEAAERFDESTFLLGTTESPNEREEDRYMVDLSHRFNESITSNLQLSYGETTRSFFSVFPAGVTAGRLNRTHFGTEDEFKSLDVKFDTEYSFETGPVAHDALVVLQRTEFDRRDLFTTFAPNFDSVDLNNPESGLPFAPLGPGRGLEGDNETFEQAIQDVARVTAGPLEGLGVVLGGRFIQFEDNLNGANDEDEFVLRAGVNYTPPSANWFTVYGGYSESFQPQNEVEASGESLEPSEGEQYEIGIKTELFDGRLLFTAAYFDLTNDNVAANDPNNPNAFITSGEQENQGFEFEVVGALTDRIQIRGQYTYNDGEVSQGNNQGNELDLTPENSASLWTRYRVPGTADLFSQGGDQLFVSAGAVYVGDRFLDIGNNIELTSYGRLDLNARYVFSEDTEVKLDVKNVTDERYFTGGSTFGGAVVPGQPITVGLSLSHEF